MTEITWSSLAIMLRALKLATAEPVNEFETPACISLVS